MRKEREEKKRKQQEQEQECLLETQRDPNKTIMPGPEPATDNDASVYGETTDEEGNGNSPEESQESENLLEGEE